MDRERVQQALREALEAFYPQVERFIKARYGVSQVVRDGMQDGFVAFLEQGWDPSKSSFEEAVLETVERQIWRSICRAKRARQKREALGHYDREHPVEMDPMVEGRHDLERLASVLTDRQQVVLKGYLEGYTRNELAKRLGISCPWTLRRTLNRAVQRMREAAQCESTDTDMKRWTHLFPYESRHDA